MGNISIPKALAQMDGIFGCKAVRTKSADGTVLTFLKKKDLLDWIFDIVFNLEAHPETRQKTIAALDGIADMVKGMRADDFEHLLAGYKSSGGKINFTEIRNTLEKFVALQFPPEVFFRDASSPQVSDALKEKYISTLRKAVINKKYEIEIIVDATGEISEKNIAALTEAIVEVEFEENEKFPALFERFTREETAPANIKFETRVPAGAREDATDILGRVMDAYVERRIARLGSLENIPAD